MAGLKHYGHMRGMEMRVGRRKRTQEVPLALNRQDDSDIDCYQAFRCLELVQVGYRSVVTKREQRKLRHLSGSFEWVCNGWRYQQCFLVFLPAFEHICYCLQADRMLVASTKLLCYSSSWTGNFQNMTLAP